MTYPHLNHLVAAGITDGFGDDWLRLGGVKAFVDGAVAGRTCWLSEPYEGTDDHGMAVIDPGDLAELARTVHCAGLRLAVHANGDEAIRVLLGAVEAARADSPAITTRHRIEHCSVVDADIVRRIAAQRMIAVPFAGYVSFHGDALVEAYGEQRLGRMFAHRPAAGRGRRRRRLVGLPVRAVRAAGRYQELRDPPDPRWSGPGGRAAHQCRHGTRGSSAPARRSPPASRT